MKGTFEMAHPQNPPPSLSFVTSALVKNKQNFVDINNLWAHLSKTSPAICNQLSKIKNPGKIPDSLKREVESAITTMAKSGPNRGHRSASQPASSAGHRAGLNDKIKAGQQRQGQPLSSLHITEPESQFAMGGGPVGSLTLEEIYLDDDSGVCNVDKKQAFEIMEEFTHRYTNFPVALLAKAREMEHTLRSRNIVERFRPEKVNDVLFHADKEKHPVSYDCIMIQLGDPRQAPIVQVDNVYTAVVKGGSADYHDVSVQLPNLNTQIKNFEKLPRDEFIAKVIQGIGEYKLCTTSPVIWTRFRTVKHLGREIQVHEGRARVKIDQLAGVWQASSKNNVWIRAWGNFDPDHVYVPLPRDIDTVKKARDAIENLGKLNAGLSFTSGGYSVRTRKGDRVLLDSKLRPELAAAIGEDLIGRDRNDCVELEVSGVPRALRDVELVQALSHKLPISGRNWTCAPIKRLPCAAPGRAIWLVRAAEVPCTTLMRIRVNHRSFPVTICPRAPPKADAIDRVSKLLGWGERVESWHDASQEEARAHWPSRDGPMAVSINNQGSHSSDDDACDGQQQVSQSTDAVDLDDGWDRQPLPNDDEDDDWEPSGNSGGSNDCSTAAPVAAFVGSPPSKHQRIPRGRSYPGNPPTRDGFTSDLAAQIAAINKKSEDDQKRFDTFASNVDTQNKTNESNISLIMDMVKKANTSNDQKFEVMQASMKELVTSVTAINNLIMRQSPNPIPPAGAPGVAPGAAPLAQPLAQVAPKPQRGRVNKRHDGKAEEEDDSDSRSRSPAGDAHGSSNDTNAAPSKPGRTS